MEAVGASILDADVPYHQEESFYRLGRIAVPVGVNHENPRQFVMRIQPFESGGFEASINKVDLARVHSLVDELAPVRTPGRREEPGERDPESILRSARRAKQKVRYISRNLGLDHLWTFTTRQDSNTRDFMARAWKRFCGKYHRRMPDGLAFDYVAVLEPHPTNPAHLHLHIAVRGKHPVNLVRALWSEALAYEGVEGNIDMKYIRVRPGQSAPARIARYISKYITKDLSLLGDFNRKRYWASRDDLPEASREVIEAASVEELKLKLRRRFAYLNWDAIESNGGVWERPDGLGLWFDWQPEWGPVDLH